MSPFALIRAPMRLFPVFLSLSAFAAVDGTIMNGTTGKAQPNTIVSLMQPGQNGLQTLATTKSDATGKFHFDQDPPGPRIIQAIYNGVIYNQVAPPEMPANNLTVQVYEPTKTPGTARLAQQIILLQPSETQLDVSENYLFENSSKLSFNDPTNGSAQVFVPEAGRASVKITITAPGGMPITRELAKTRDAGVFKVDYPLKPGETRFDISYTVPAVKPMIFSGHTVGGARSTRFVVPNGVTLKGDNLELLGQEPTTQASIYSLKGDKYQIEVTGFGTMNNTQPPSGEDAGMPQLRADHPRIYDRLWLLLVLTVVILTIGTILLYRRGQAPSEKK